MQVVDQRTAFDDDPDGFSTAMDDNQALQQRVVEAQQQRLEQVVIDEDLRLRISSVCGELWIGWPAWRHRHQPGSPRPCGF